ncbi:hypothetical protein CKO15_11735, partial [Halorhodospira abdelmalekii]|uniref:hypothetical protein n=1 Tax=Halorhodospira abdelmalekii TaxID=421629 RepID=UPI001904D856
PDSSPDSSRALVESDPYAAATATSSQESGSQESGSQDSGRIVPYTGSIDSGNSGATGGLGGLGTGSTSNANWPGAGAPAPRPRPPERWERFQHLADSTENGLSAEAERAVRHRIALGELLGMPLERENSPLERQHLEARIGGLLRGVDSRIVLQEPELYGLIFAPSWTDMQSSDYRHQVLASRVAVPTAMLAVFAGVVLGTLGWIEQRADPQIHRQLDAQQERYLQRLSAAEAARPSQARLNELQASLELYERERQSLRLDHLLAWISREIPEDGQIVRLQMQPAGELSTQQTRGRRAAPEPTTPQGPPEAFVAELKIVLHGDFERTRSLAESVLDRLGKRVRLAESNFSYDPDLGQAGAGVLNTRLQFRAQEMAPREGEEHQLVSQSAS